MSVEFLPVVIGHFPAGILEEINLWVLAATLREINLSVHGERHEAALEEKNRAAIRLLLKSAFEQYHHAANISIYFG